jgi:hypothetical protein
MLAALPCSSFLTGLTIAPFVPAAWFIEGKDKQWPGRAGKGLSQIESEEKLLLPAPEQVGLIHFSC